jgi:hypothetical protein
MILKGGLGGRSKTALIACVTQAEDSISESVSTLRFAMQSSHVKNKVAKKDAQDKKNEEKDKIAAKGNSLILEDGKGTVPLPAGPMEVIGSWGEGAGERAVILLPGLNTKLESLRQLVNALAAQGCSVLAPKLSGKAEKDLEADVEALAGLLDWLGLAQPVVYGRDWGAIRACRLKIAHPKRVKHLVLEDFHQKVDEKQYKERVKKDPNYVMQGMMGPFLWFFDGTYPKNLDGKGGKNMQGFKGKATLLWPLHNKGKHDPRESTATFKFGQNIAKVVNTKLVDSFPMGDQEVAAEILKALPP